MAPTPRSAVFLDTNILVYSTFPGAPFYDTARSRLGKLESTGAVFWTSRQTHDAKVVATMRRCGIPSLLTHNRTDFTRYLPDISLLPLIS